MANKFPLTLFHFTWVAPTKKYHNLGTHKAKILSGILPTADKDVEGRRGSRMSQMLINVSAEHVAMRLGSLWCQSRSLTILVWNLRLCCVVTSIDSQDRISVLWLHYKEKLCIDKWHTCKIPRHTSKTYRYGKKMTTMGMRIPLGWTDFPFALAHHFFKNCSRVLNVNKSQISSPK